MGLLPTILLKRSRGRSPGLHGGGVAVAGEGAASGGWGEDSGNTTALAAGEGLASGEISDLPVSGEFSVLPVLAVTEDDVEGEEDDDAVRFALRCRCVVEVEW